MEFKPEKTKTRLFSGRRLIFVFIVLLVLVIGFFEIYSPIYIKNFEDLDVKAEAERVGGDFYEKDGDRMYVADYKKSDATDTLILIHGMDASSFSWSNNISDLTLKYHVIAFDLLGFGMSKITKSDDIGLDRSTDIISSYINDKKLKNITVIGHDMGGIVAQKLALKHPSDVISVVLINSKDASKPDSQNVIVKDLGAFSLVKNPYVYFTYNGIKSMVERSYYDKSLIQKLTFEGYQKGFRYQGSSDQYIKFLKSSAPKKEDLSQIKQLTLIYSSTDDAVLNKSVSENLSKEIPNSTLITIPKAGHLLMQEQPGLVDEGILKWVDEAHAKQNMA